MKSPDNKSKQKSAKHHSRGFKPTQQPKLKAKAIIDNPFDRFANSRKKHEVVNRRVKGEDRNVGRALAKAVETRKKNLLNDHLASKKTNTFADKLVFLSLYL